MVKKIKYIILFVVFMILGLCTKSQARITTSDPTVSSGGTATITINSQEAVASGAIDVVSDGGLTFVEAGGGTVNGTLIAFSGATDKTNGIATYKFKVPQVSKTTTYKVTFSASDMAKADGTIVENSEATSTVTVQGKAQESSSSGNNSSSGNSTSNGNSKDNEEETKAPSFSSVNETVYVTDDGINVRASYSTSSEAIGTLNRGDKLTRTGRSSETVNGIRWSRVEYNGRTAYVSSSYLTTEEPTKSTNKALKSLSIEGYTLTPEFDSDTIEYTLNVPENVASLEIEAEPEDENAQVEITGNEQLLDGVNTIEITVTAEDGTERTYTVSVTKGEFVGLGLSNLSIEGYTLVPEFSKDVYNYSLTIEDLGVTQVDVNAICDEEDASLEILGNTNLKPGENTITILVKSEDGEDVVTYQIKVNIIEKQQEEEKKDLTNYDFIIYGGIALAALIVIVLIISIAKHRNKELDEEETSEENNKKKKINKKENNETEKKENIDNTQELADVINNKNMPIEEKHEEETEEENKKKEYRKSVIEENFGADIKNEDNINNDEKTGRKKGKHF